MSHCCGSSDKEGVALTASGSSRQEGRQIFVDAEELNEELTRIARLLKEGDLQGAFGGVTVGFNDKSLTFGEVAYIILQSRDGVALAALFTSVANRVEKIMAKNNGRIPPRKPRPAGLHM